MPALLRTTAEANPNTSGIIRGWYAPLGIGSSVALRPASRERVSPSLASDSNRRTRHGPGYGADTQLQSELKVHRVSAWTVDDLSALLASAANPAEIRPLLAPGFAEDHVADALWERAHGRAKRVAVIAETLVAAGWDTQLSAAGVEIV
jgi:hypothetical protein